MHLPELHTAPGGASHTVMDRCEELADPSIPQFVVSIWILLGLVISYLPQHWRIVKRRSSAGLSPYFVLLGTTAGTCALANILTLPTSRADIGCCGVNSSFSCAAGLLGIAQITVQWSCFFLITFLFLIFIPRHDPYPLVPSHLDGDQTSMDPNLKTASIVVAVAIAHFVFTFLVSIVMLAKFPQLLQEWANILGVCAALLASVQYIPQIWTTWHLQEAGSLSIPMMLIQTPGGFLFAASLAARLGPSGWSAWAQYIVLAVLQGCLLVMAIYFEYKKKRLLDTGDRRMSIFSFLNRRPAEASAQGYDSQDEGGTNIEGQEGERSPLLAHNTRRNGRPSNGYNTAPLSARDRLLRQASATSSVRPAPPSPKKSKKGSISGASKHSRGEI